MKNKKLLLITLTAILLASLFVVSVAAAGAVATTDGKSCGRGQTVILNVSIPDVSSVYAGAVEVEYDSSVLTFVEAKWNVSGAVLAHYDTATDKGAFALDAESTVGGKIFSVTFKVRDDAPLGKSAVECKIQLKNQNGDSISVTNNAGYVDVTCNHSFDQKNDQHLASAATCTSPAKYYYTCSTCGKVGTTTYTSGEALPHTFDQKKATAEYLVSEVKCVSEAEYYYSCSCGAAGSEKFTADASWSHNYSSNWYVNTDTHWHQCADCGLKKDETEHIPDENKVCTSCNFQITTEPEHQHSFGDSLLNNDEEHWYECSCGLKNEVEAHQWSEGHCTVCGAEDKNYDPNPPVEDPEDPENKPEDDPETPDKGDEDSGDAIINFMVYFVDNLALILLLLIGITMVILLMIILIRDRHYWRY